MTESDQIRKAKYRQAMRRSLASKISFRGKPGERYFTREEVNDRAMLRRLHEREKRGT